MVSSLAMTAAEKTPWLTYEQAAARLGCSTKTIQRLVRDGRLTAHRRPGTPNRFLAETQIAEMEAPAPLAAAQ